MSDESLREFHVSGKQLVFAFMAATAVAVVIFLTGVQVGRGVPGTTPGARTAAAPEVSEPEIAPLPDPLPGVADAPADDDPVDYPGLLLGADPPPETLEAPSIARAAPMPPPVVADEEVPPPAVDAPTLAGGETIGGAAADAPGLTLEPLLPAIRWQEPAGTGFVVQVAAVSQRSEAEVIASDLDTKGYSTFITVPEDGGPRVFRVRVGKFADRGEAQVVADRLASQEQFEPWITR